MRDLRFLEPWFAADWISPRYGTVSLVQ